MARYARVDMDAVAPLMPADKVASRVAGKGESFEFKTRTFHTHSDVPIKMRPITDQTFGNPLFVNLTGKKVGRLTVLGIADIEKAHDGKPRWVCRCVCGAYEVRRTAYIKKCLAGENPGEEEPMCEWCGKTRKLQKGIGVVRSGPLVSGGCQP